MRPRSRRDERGILPFWADSISATERMILRRVHTDGPLDRTVFHGAGLLALVNRRLIAIVGERVHLTEEGMDVVMECVAPVPASVAMSCPICGRVADRTDPWERRWMTFHAAEHAEGRLWFGRDPREEPRTIG